MSGGRRKEEPPQPQLANGALKVSVWSKVLRSDAAWEDKVRCSWEGAGGRSRLALGDGGTGPSLPPGYRRSFGLVGRVAKGWQPRRAPLSAEGGAPAGGRTGRSPGSPRGSVEGAERVCCLNGETELNSA